MTRLYFVGAPLFDLTLYLASVARSINTTVTTLLSQPCVTAITSAGSDSVVKSCVNKVPVDNLTPTTFECYFVSIHNESLVVSRRCAEWLSLSLRNVACS
jgi:hypothetical protein